MTTWTATLQNITANAERMSLANVLVTIITLPFFVIGWLVGMVFMAVLLVWSACAVGFGTARNRSDRGA